MIRTFLDLGTNAPSMTCPEIALTPGSAPARDLDGKKN